MARGRGLPGGRALHHLARHLPGLDDHGPLLPVRFVFVFVFGEDLGGGARLFVVCGCVWEVAVVVVGSGFVLCGDGMGRLGWISPSIPASILHSTAPRSFIHSSMLPTIPYLQPRLGREQPRGGPGAPLRGRRAGGHAQVSGTCGVGMTVCDVAWSYHEWLDGWEVFCCAVDVS